MTPLACLGQTIKRRLKQGNPALWCWFTTFRDSSLSGPAHVQSFSFLNPSFRGRFSFAINHIGKMEVKTLSSYLIRQISATGF